jgi:hypothetical protein
MGLKIIPIPLRYLLVILIVLSPIIGVIYLLLTDDDETPS